MTDTADQILAYDVMDMLGVRPHELSPEGARQYIESWETAGLVLAFIHLTGARDHSVTGVYTTKNYNDESGCWAITDISPYASNYLVSVGYKENCWPRAIVVAALECIGNSGKGVQRFKAAS